jgi:NAD-dependent dihydropyrimidine dehydrogenase PreA subunit
MPIKIDNNSCTGCGVCILICPCDVIRIDEQKKKVFPAYNIDCAVCRLCQMNCSFDAIQVFTHGTARKGIESFALKQYLIGLGGLPKT